MPSILTARQEHRLYCQHPPETAWTGDVRRCEHGRIQMAHDVPGFGSAQWFDLDPIFNPINYLTRDTSPAARCSCKPDECEEVGAPGCYFGSPTTPAEPAPCEHDGKPHCPRGTPDCECPTAPAVPKPVPHDHTEYWRARRVLSPEQGNAS